jgi:membrane protein implicated in regulation of membrane protease activity
MNLTAYYKEAIAGVFVPDVFWWFLLGFLLLLLFILLIAWYYRRRRRKEDTQAFHSGWTAWYYCYNIPKKPY